MLQNLLPYPGIKPTTYLKSPLIYIRINFNLILHPKPPILSGMKTDLKNIMELKPLHPGLERIYERLMVDLIKDHLIGSTLVEGSTLSELEAQQVLEGKTIAGHTVDEHLELEQGKLASSYIHRLFFQGETITPGMIDKAQEIMFTNVGSRVKKHPGKNRGQTGTSAFTLLLKDGLPMRVEYEHPQRVKSDYGAFLNFHVNRPLPDGRDDALIALAKLYFHFQMLHPYSDGNGRIGRLLLSAKMASQKGWFFNFHLSDGPAHLKIMMAATLEYLEDKALVDLSPLVEFFAKNIKNYEAM